MNINYKTKLPTSQIPIAIIGAGGIVRDAHLPAYRKAGFNVIGIFDINIEKAEQLSKEYKILNVCRDLDELIDLSVEHKAVFDLAVPAFQFIDVLSKLPDNAAVLMQKPMGENIQQAREILSICRRKRFTAAVNFQLRFAPFINAARSMANSGVIGEIYDMEIKLCTFTPWHLWAFLENVPRVEILYHSIHYVDVVRSFLGEPKRVMAKSTRNPGTTLSSTRSAIILDYGDVLSAAISTNHDHKFGTAHQQSYIKWEGTKGAIYAEMGLLLNYPHGSSDKFEYCVIDSEGKTEWKTVELDGSWFPDAFIGSMSSLMCFIEGSGDVLPTSVENAIKTMELVESAYRSSDMGLQK